MVDTGRQPDHLDLVDKEVAGQRDFVVKDSGVRSVLVRPPICCVFANVSVRSVAPSYWQC